MADLWHRAGQAAYTYLPTWQSFGLAEGRRVFRDIVVADLEDKDEIWVAESKERVVAYLALRGRVIDRLYVDPPCQGAGVGSRLLELAKDRRPLGLELYTHRDNLGARRFYERHGFVAVAFGVSPPPESAPDVRYAWTPS